MPIETACALGVFEIGNAWSKSLCKHNSWKRLLKTPHTKSLLEPRQKAPSKSTFEKHLQIPSLKDAFECFTCFTNSVCKRPVQRKAKQNAWWTVSSEGLRKSTVEASSNAALKSHSQRPHLQAYPKCVLYSVKWIGSYKRFQRASSTKLFKRPLQRASLKGLFIQPLNTPLG